MTETPQVPNKPLEFLTFTLRSQDYAVDIMSVREIRRWTDPTPLPRTPEFLCGVINLRGTVLPVLDLSARLGIETSEPTDRTVIVVLQTQKHAFGVTVDAVSDIMNFPPDTLQDPPEMKQDDDADFIQSLCLQEDRLIRILDVASLVPGAVNLPKSGPFAA